MKPAHALAGLALLLSGAVTLWLAMGTDRPPSGDVATPAAAPEPAAEPAPLERPQSEPSVNAASDEPRRTAELPRGLRPRPVEAASGTLDVEVSWSDSARPAAGIPLGAFRLDSNMPDVAWSETASDGEGRARFASLPPGRVRIASGLGGAVEARIVSDETRSVRLVLDVGYRLQGRTIDASGRAVSNASLWILRPGSRDSLRVGESDANGRFELPGAVSGLRLFARSLERSPSVPVTLGGPETARVELRIALGMAGATVSGQVVDGDEQALAGAAVALEPLGLVGGEPPPRALAITDAEGRFLLAGCEGGAARLLVLHEDAVPFDQQITALPGQRNDHIVRLARGTLVAGTVYGSDGKPAADIPLRLAASHPWLARETRSDSSGAYVLRGVPAGTARITVGAATQVVEVPRDSTFTWNPRLRAPTGN